MLLIIEHAFSTLNVTPIRPFNVHGLVNMNPCQCPLWLNQWTLLTTRKLRLNSETDSAKHSPRPTANINTKDFPAPPTHPFCGSDRSALRTVLPDFAIPLFLNTVKFLTGEENYVINPIFKVLVSRVIHITYPTDWLSMTFYLLIVVKVYNIAKNGNTAFADVRVETRSMNDEHTESSCTTGCARRWGEERSGCCENVVQPSVCRAMLCGFGVRLITSFTIVSTHLWKI